MRLLLVSGEYPPMPGGVADYSHNLAEALAAAGHDVSVITTPAGKTRDSSSAVSVIEVAGWRRAGDAELMARARAFQPDAVLLQYVPHLYGRWGVAPGIAGLPGRLKAISGARVVTVLHELFQPWSVSGMAWSALQRRQLLRLLAGSDVVVTTNQRYEAEVRKRGAARVVTIPVGPSVGQGASTAQDAVAFRKQQGLVGRSLIGEVGATGVAKRPDDLVAIVAGLDPLSTALLIGGLPWDDAARDKVMRRAGTRGLTDGVRATGYLTPEVLSAALGALDCYVHTSRDGASPRSTSLAAALAHGVPVVAYRGRETPSSFDDGKSMLLVSPGDIAAATQAVRAVLHDPDLSRRLGAGGRRLQDLWMSWPAIAGQFSDLARRAPSLAAVPA